MAKKKAAAKSNGTTTVVDPTTGDEIHKKPVKSRKPRKVDEPKAKQQYLDDELKPPSIPEIDKAAEQYVGLRDERMQLTEDEVDAREKLQELMKKHQLTEYRTPEGMKVVYETTEKVKVRRAATEELPE